jgi:hypothetical protein
MGADFLQVHGWRNKLSALFGPPAWATAYHASRNLEGAERHPEQRDGTSINNPAAFQAPRRPGKIL